MSFLTQQTGKCWSSLEAADPSVLPFAPCETHQSLVFTSGQNHRGEIMALCLKREEVSLVIISLVIMVINPGWPQFSLGISWL